MKYIKFRFSVIELIAACAVIIILMTIGLGVYRLIITKINETRTVALVKKLEMAMRSYKNETGYYFQSTENEDNNFYNPLQISESDTTFTQLIDYTGMRGKNEINSDGYVIDAWGNKVFYNNGSDKRNTTLFDIGSPGKSAGWGGEDAADSDVNYFGTGDDITNANMQNSINVRN